MPFALDQLASYSILVRTKDYPSPLSEIADHEATQKDAQDTHVRGRVCLRNNPLSHILHYNGGTLVETTGVMESCAVIAPPKSINIPPRRIWQGLDCMQGSTLIMTYTT